MTYSVIANGIGWAVVREGIVEGNFATKGAAFAFAQGVSEAGAQEDVKVVNGGDGTGAETR